jgi:phospho-N-acetylmuramoyl-pentapeptide-transferase
MRQLLLGASFATVIALVCTPPLISLLRRLRLGSQERLDGVRAHLSKQGTPTLGGVIIMGSATLAYLLTRIGFSGGGLDFRAPSASAIVILGTAWSLGIIGLADDLISAVRRRSLGLSPLAKSLGQAAVSVALAIALVRWLGVPPEVTWAGTEPLISHVPSALFVVWVFVIIWGMSNGFNVTDGLDGLSSGTAAFALFAYVIIAFWQFRNPSIYGGIEGEHLLETSAVAAALLGSFVGFLWWNAPPAKIFLGDGGAMAVGGGLAAMALVTRTQLLLPVITALVVIVYGSSLLQIAVFKATRRLMPDEHGRGRRVFRMAPLHLHFELSGRAEVTVMMRFLLIAGLATGFGIGIFYAAFLASGGAE